jgi:quercetin dioxygenase-like cupin family protein
MVPQGYVLGPREGEHLVLRGGDIFIKVDPIGGSDSLAMGTQQILIGDGIPIHRHFEMDEAFCVIEGSGLFILDDVHHRIEKGASIFIPKNTWHGFENADSELVLLWMVAPPGLECLFREIATPAPIQRTKASTAPSLQSARSDRTCHVRFTSESGHVRCTSGCPLWANSGHSYSNLAGTENGLVASTTNIMSRTAYPGRPGFPA